MSGSTKKGLTLDQVIAALRAHNGNVSLTARSLKVTRNAVQYYIRTYQTAADAVAEASEAISDYAEGHLVKAVMSGDLQQARYWLENKARDRGWGAVKYAAELQIDPSKLSEMSDDDLDALAAKIDRLAGRR
jgi:hypothetical protein